MGGLGTLYFALNLAVNLKSLLKSYILFKNKNPCLHKFYMVGQDFSGLAVLTF